jgi:hypothetical protein
MSPWWHDQRTKMSLSHTCAECSHYPTTLPPHHYCARAAKLTVATNRVCAEGSIRKEA